MEDLQRPMYVIKEKYRGLIITRTLPGVGTITLDTNKVKDSDLWKYLDLFGDIIEEVKVNSVTITMEEEKKPAEQPVRGGRKKK